MANSHNDSQRSRVTTAQVPVADVARTVPTVQASAVDSYVEPKQNGLLALAKGLSQASPGFKSYFDKRTNEKNELDRAAAIEAANRSGDKSETKAINSLLGSHRTQSAEFDKYYMQQTGINIANDVGNKLIDNYDVWSAENPSGDLEAFIQDNVTKETQGIDDPDFRLGLLETLAPMETKLREHHTKRVRAEVDADVDKLTFGAYRDSFTQVDEATGLFKPVDAAGFEKIRLAMNKLGVTNAELNGHIYNAAVLASLPDANGIAHPEVFDSLMNKGVNGGASLGFTAEYGEQIQKARAKAVAANAAGKAIISKTNQAATVMAMEKDIERGIRFTDKDFMDNLFDPSTEQGAKGALTLGNITRLKGLQDAEDKDSSARNDMLFDHTMRKQIDAGVVVDTDVLASTYLVDKPKLQASLLTYARTVEKSGKTLSTVTNAFADGEALSLHSNPEVKNSDIKKGFEQRHTLHASKYDLNTPDGLNGYITATLNDAIPAGNLVPRSWSVMMDSANPKLDAKGFTAAVDFYNSIKRSPYGEEYADRMLSDDKAAQFDAYTNLVDSLKVEPTEAISMIVNVDDTAMEGGKRRVTKDYGYQNIRDHVASELSEVGGILGFGDTPVRGVDGLVDTIVEMATIRAADGTSGEAAVAWATERFMKVNTFVNGRYQNLPREQNLGQPLSQAADWMAKRIEQEFHPDEVSAGVELKWNPHTKKWIAHNIATGIPIAPDGIPMEFDNAADMVADYQTWKINDLMFRDSFKVKPDDDQATVIKKHHARQAFEREQREREEARLLK